MSAVRSVTVRLDAAVAKYIADMKAAGKATDDAFSRSSISAGRLNRHLSDSTTRVSELRGESDGLNRELGRTATLSDRVAKSMDRIGDATRKAAPAQRRLVADVDALEDSTSRAAVAQNRLRSDIDGVRSSARRAGPEIDRLSGRLRLWTDLALTIGPSVAPIGAVAVPALTGLASQLGFAALGAGSLVTAFQGVGDALKAVNQAALEPTAANLEKAQAAMVGLGPDAQAFVTRFQELRPVLSMIRDASAAGWFPGLTESLDSLERVAPEIASLFQRIGEVGGNLLAEGAAAFAGPGWADFRAMVADQAPKMLDDLGRTIGNLIGGLARLWQAFTPLNSDFSDWMLDASRSFQDWAAGLSQTEGFAEFVDYIRTNGPRVADALKAVGDAVLEIIEAVAPLGGPSLKIIETFGKAIGAIADSDLGTPIFGAAAALVVLNRSLQATAALQTKLSGSTALSGAMASGGLFGVSKTGLATIKAGIPTLSQFGTVATRIGQSSKFASEQTLAARSAVRGFGSQVGRVAGPVAGLGIAMSGAADGMGLTNTASLALMGTVAGPFGAAVGAGAGLVMDFAAANNELEAALKAANLALETGDIEQMSTALAGLNAQYEDLTTMTGVGDGLGDFFSAFGDGISVLFGDDTHYDEVTRKQEELRKSIAATREESLKLAQSDALASRISADSEAAAAAADSFRNLANAYEAPTTSLRDLIKQMEDLGRASRDQAQNIQTALTNGLDPRAIEDIAKQFGPAAGLIFEDLAKGGEEAARRTNKAFGFMQTGANKYERKLNEVARATRDLPDAEMGLDTRVFEKKFRDVQAGLGVLGREKTDPWVGLYTPPFDKKKKGVEVDLEDLDNSKSIPQIFASDHASPVIRGTKRELNSLDGKRAEVFIDIIRSGKLSLGFSADGGFVPKTGLPYADRHLYALADGEGITTNRRGETDRFRDVVEGINAGKSRAQIKGMLASGGIAGDPSPSLHTRSYTPKFDADRTTVALSRLEHSARTAAGAIDLGTGFLKQRLKLATEERDAIKTRLDLMRQERDAVKQSIHDRFSSNPFERVDAYQIDAPTTEELKGLSAEEQAARQIAVIEANEALRKAAQPSAKSRLKADEDGLLEMETLIKQLKRKGLDGSALAALLSGGDMEQIRDYASSSRKQLTRYGRSFERRERLLKRVGNVAGDAAYGREIAGLKKELGEANQIAKRMEKRMAKAEEQREQAPERTGRAVGKVINRGAVDGKLGR